jgi:cytochrome c oxidase subunit 2
VGPSFKGIYGTTQTVVTNGKEREITVDDDYLRRSILQPKADIVKGYPPSMPDQSDIVTSMDVENVIEYLKTLQ